MGQTKNKLYALFLRNPTVDNKEKCVAYRNKFKSLRKLVAVIKLSGGWGWDGSTPSSFFNPPSLFSKITLGVRLNPPEQRSIAQCILLSACIKRFPTRVSFRMIRSSEGMTVLWIIYLFTSVDVAHAGVLFLYIYAIYTAMYMRLYCGSHEIKSLNAAECSIGWHKINGTYSCNCVWATF